MIHVYCIRTDAQNVSASALETRVASCIDTLPAAKRDRILHIRPSQARVNSALGWCLLRFALRDRGMGQIEVAASLVACAITDTGRVGIDCERLRPVNAAALLRRILSSNQRAPSDADARAFFRLWTQKEAVIKAEGNGGVWDMARVHTDDATADYRGTRWHLYPVALADDYIAHVASDIAERCITMHAVSIEQLLGDEGARDQPAPVD